MYIPLSNVPISKYLTKGTLYVHGAKDAVQRFSLFLWTSSEIFLSLGFQPSLVTFANDPVTPFPTKTMLLDRKKS